MGNINYNQNTILGNLRQSLKLDNLFGAIFFMLIGTIALTISAKINIPFIPVPATFQTMVVAIIAASFGWRLGVATIALYLAQGAFGLPVFANGGGFAYLMGPTGGFLLGFLPAAFIIGKLAENGASKNLFLLFLAMIIGNIFVFALGFFWLLAFGAGGSWLDEANLFASAYNVAIKPFIIWDILKMALAAISVYGVCRFISTKKGD